MGEVYKARDTRLDRTVALKILPQSLTLDPHFRERFDREARAISQLEHPHICALYDVGDEKGMAYLVMQYLEGETLASRLGKGALPLGQGLRYAIEIAGALDKAHRAGIVHRDLKPANIMLTKGGAKLLDFGLAKSGAVGAGGGVTGLSMLPTTPPSLTVQGTILGTFQYMAPEQLEGGDADARTDIFAFGAVLYEMLTGRKAFVGKSQASLISAIMSSEPATISTIQPLAPKALDQIVRTCLAKDPDQRWQTAADIERQLRWIADAQTQASVVTTTPALVKQRPLNMAIVAALAGVTGAIVASVVTWAVRDRPTPVEPQRLSMVLPAPNPVSFPGLPGSSLALSPDGTAIVFAGLNRDEKPARPHLWLRSLNTLATRALPGTEDARQPFFSPDGRWVGFFTRDGKLKKVSLAGGNALTIVDKINGSNWGFGAWTGDDTIVFGAPSNGLQQVPADGGSAVAVTTVDESQSGHLDPQIVLPTRAVLFTVEFAATQEPRIDAVLLDTRERRVVLENAFAPRYLPSGHLLFQRDDAILVAPFDASRLVITGPPMPIADAIRRDGTASIGTRAQLAVSRSGTLAFVPAIDGRGTLGLVGQTGVFNPIGVSPDRFRSVAASPNGQQVAFTTGPPLRQQVSIHDLARGTTSKLTQEGSDSGPAWHPSNRALAVASITQKSSGLFYKDLSGTERLLVPGEDSTFKRNASWSPDGRVLAYTVQTGSRHDIWTVTVDDTPRAQPLPNSHGNEHSPRFSPDGSWLAYVSGTPGGRDDEVWVTKYPHGEPTAISTSGGRGPIWSRDGKALYFHEYEGAPRMMKAPVVVSGDSMQVGKPQPLFDLRVPGPDGVVQYALSTNAVSAYDVLPDGRFVMIRRVEQDAREIVLVQHWFEEVKRLFQTR
jgi:serine/threonine-protein kinase